MNRTLRAATVRPLDAIPGLVHGFEQRLGPDGWEDREETRHRVSLALSASGRLHLLKQVHGCRVSVAPWEGWPEADAAVAARPGPMHGNQTARRTPNPVLE